EIGEARRVVARGLRIGGRCGKCSDPFRANGLANRDDPILLFGRALRTFPRAAAAAGSISPNTSASPKERQPEPNRAGCYSRSLLGNSAGGFQVLATIVPYRISLYRSSLPRRPRHA